MKRDQAVILCMCQAPDVWRSLHAEQECTVTTPATELLSSRCLTRPLKCYTPQRVGAQHRNSFKRQMWETECTPPVGDKESGSKRHVSTRRKTSLQITPVIRKRPIKVSPGFLFFDFTSLLALVYCRTPARLNYICSFFISCHFYLASRVL